MCPPLRVTPRGFRIYHETKDMYGRTVRVVESSGVEPGIWIQPGDDGDASRAGSRNMRFSPEALFDFALELLKASQEKAAA